MTGSPNVYVSRGPNTNDFPTECSNRECQLPIEPGEGVVLRQPKLRVICPVCAILSPYPSDLELRLEQQYCTCETLEAGRGACRTCGKLALRLRDFQLQDCRKLQRYRAHLIGNQMGTGKTIEACVGALRADMPNFLFVPAALKKNWQREIKLWRPDLKAPGIVDGPAAWCNRFKSTAPGGVLIASYGSIPGLDCKGCLYRIKVEKAAGKRGRWRPGQCTHDTSPHPVFKDAEGREPYHLLRPLKGQAEPRVCPGCVQHAPVPDIQGPAVWLCDEAHAFKGPNARRTRLWRKLVTRGWYKGGLIFGLTGTPWENRPVEGWEVLTSLGLERGAFGTWEKFHDLFSDWLDKPKEERKALEGEKRSEFLVRMRRVRIFRRTRDHVALPPRVQQDIYVDLSPKVVNEVNETVQRMFAARRAWHDVEAGQLDDPFKAGLPADELARRKLLYEERVERYFVQKPWDFDQEVVSAVEEVMLTRNKRKDGAEKNLFKIRRMLALAKIKAVEQWVSDCEEQEEPVVLFCQHLEMIKRFGTRPGWTMLHGSMNDDAKDDAVVRFQSGEVPRGIAISSAGREGITLTRARVLGFVDLSFNPARNRQIEARVLRIGAEVHESVLIVRFLSQHPVDKQVLRLLTEKEALLESIEEDSELVAA